MGGIQSDFDLSDVTYTASRILDSSQDTKFNASLNVERLSVIYKVKKCICRCFKSRSKFSITFY